MRGFTVIFPLIIILLVLFSSLGYTQSSGYLTTIQTLVYAQSLSSESSRLTSQPSPKGNYTTHTCPDDEGGFTIDYNRSWYKSPKRCIYFSPIFDIFSKDNIIEPFVRISVSNLSNPNMTSQQAFDAVFRTVSDGANLQGIFNGTDFQALFEPSRDPRFNYEVDGNRAFVVYYKILNIDLSSEQIGGPDMVALPFVDLLTAYSSRPRISSLDNISSSGLSTDPGGVVQGPVSEEPAQEETASPLLTTGNTQTTNVTGGGERNETVASVTRPDTLARILAIYTIYNGKVYVIEYVSPESEYNIYLPTFMEMEGSFKFTK